MRLYYEFGARQLNKFGEELCGDTVSFQVQPDFVTVVLSDGLGSGVKANILATLTSRIASHLIAEGLPVDAVVETVSETLPVCRVRKLAYSTFAIAKLSSGGGVELFEHDSPHVFFLREGRVQRPEYRQRLVQNRTVLATRLEVRLGDWLVLVSDGVINAGIGGAWSLGWGWDEIGRFLERYVHPARTAQDVADAMAQTVNDLYEGRPGDDVSIAVIKVRRHRVATVFTGPPLRREDNAAVVQRLLAARGQRIVCGGTTAQIVAQALGCEVAVRLDTATADVPPMGEIPGIDLVTEGVLTLSRTLDNLRARIEPMSLRFKTDGASALTRVLYEADEVHFLVGSALNPAHQNPEMPAKLGLKAHIVREIAAELEKLGKLVTVTTV